MKIGVFVKPNSRREKVEKLPNGSFRIFVNAPPVENRANERVIELLADHLSIPKSRLTIVAGGRGRKKRLEVT